MNISIPGPGNLSNGKLITKYFDYVTYNMTFPDISNHLSLSMEGKEIYRLSHQNSIRKAGDSRTIYNITTNTTGFSASRGNINIPSSIPFIDASGNQLYIGTTLINAANNSARISTTLQISNATQTFNRPGSIKAYNENIPGCGIALSPVDSSSTGPGAGGGGKMCRVNTYNLFGDYTTPGCGYFKITYLGK